MIEHYGPTLMPKPLSWDPEIYNIGKGLSGHFKYAFSFNLFLSIDVFMFYTYTLGAADLLTWGS
jgi:hypothetical protein